MKKIFLVPILIFALLFLPSKVELYKALSTYSTEVKLYSMESARYIEEASLVDLGVYREYTSKPYCADIVHNGVGSVVGQTVTVELTVEEVLKLLGAMEIARQEVDGLEIVYAYSYKLCGGVKVDGRDINLEIVKGNGKTLVGSPLVLGSY